MDPVIIGVGDIKNKTKELRQDGSDEPLQLILQAIHQAISDTSISPSAAKNLQASIDSIDVVKPWTWPYPDAASSVAEKLNVRPTHKYVSPHGGNQPAKLLDEASRRVSLGQTKVAVVTGGEALDSLNRYMQAKKFPPPAWTPVGEEAFSRNLLRPPSENNLKGIHQVGSPIHVYPLYENGFRAKNKQSFQQNHDESAQLYANFAKVSESNPLSWNYGKPAETKDSIGSVNPKNRMICFPYPLLMNAFNTINIAGAVIVTSTAYAKQLGVPQSKWIYPLGGAGTAESEDFWLRTNFHSSPAVEQSLDAGLAVSALTKDQIDVFDIYSCFPIVPKVVCAHLGYPTTHTRQPLTLLGGLTSFGGAGNNYSMHAVTEMTRYLRAGKGRNGLILANGGVMSYQHVVCLSSSPRSSAYPRSAPLPEHVTDAAVPAFDAEAEGEAVVETYTVEFERDGTPLRGHVVGRLQRNDHRFVANHGDEATLRLLCSTAEEPIGKVGYVGGDPAKKGRNLFTLGKTARL